jgi:hypothetical protein
MILFELTNKQADMLLDAMDILRVAAETVTPYADIRKVCVISKEVKELRRAIFDAMCNEGKLAATKVSNCELPF